MRKVFSLVILFMFISACSQNKKKISLIQKKEITKPENGILEKTAVNTLIGNFNGDNKIEIAYVDQKNSSVDFLNDTMIPIILNSNTGEFRLFNEGDLDNDGSNELSVYQSYDDIDFDIMTTYSFKDGNWTEIIESFQIFNNGKRLSDKEIENKVFTKNKIAYYYDFEDFEKVLIKHAENLTMGISNRNYKIIKKKVIK